jgi:hypothetical protein
VNRQTGGAYVARETLVSAGVNAAISVAFFLGVFGGIDPVPLWGVGNYAFDFVPQSFAIGFMATLVPGLLARKALARGRIAGSGTVPGAGAIVARALVNGLLAVAVGAGLCALVLWASGAESIGHAAAFLAKVIYGALLGALVTWRVLLRLLA